MHRPVAWLALILGAYLVILGRGVDHGFVWDDVQEIELNGSFDHSLADGLLLTQTARTDPELVTLREIALAYDSYRPLLFATQWLEVRVFGRDPLAMHVTNLVLGALAILLAYAVARRWLRTIDAPPWAALLATGVFALHPIQVEPVAYVSGRGDLLAGLLALVATYAAERARDRCRWIGVAGVAFALSLLTKESCIGLPAAIAALAFARGELRRRWWIPAALVGVALAYLVLRAAMVTATSSGALAGGIAGLPGVWLEYLRIAALPFDLSTERVHAADVAIAGWAVVLVACGGVLALRQRATATARLVAAGLAWFALLLAPAAVSIVSMGVAADRYAYVAMLGIAVALAAAAAWAIRAWPRARIGVVVAFAAWGALLATVAWRQVGVWRDNATLYAHAVAMAPESADAHYRLGFLAARDGDWARAIPLLERAVVLAPAHVRALNNLGVGLMQTGRLGEAEAMLARAVATNPAHFRAWLNLGIARHELGARAAGCTAIRRALELAPQYEAARAQLARRCSSSVR